MKKLAILSHGKESGPNGKKLTKLKRVAEKHGYEAISLDYTQCNNATERIALLKEYIEKSSFESLVLVGSSMGGYVSTVLANDYRLSGLFLLCPALYMEDKEEYTVKDFSPKCKNIEIIHGWSDEVVPFDHSIQFGEQTHAVVNLIEDNHRLQHSHAFMEKRFEWFLSNLKLEGNNPKNV
jgi:pimeloyl-ACP methyl ester carboxylesterase